jgi:NAD(P)-dependent dehydrogenase (short-subunit alcohol dehydrogenase family)
MSSAAIASPTAHDQDLVGRTVVVIGGSSGIGLETARLARARGADVILTARNPDRLAEAGRQVGARDVEAFDVTDLARLERFFEELSGPVDHILLTGGGPYYSALADMDFDRARRDLEEHILVTLAVARYGAARIRPPGTLLFMSGTGGRHTEVGFTIRAELRSTLHTS